MTNKPKQQGTAAETKHVRRLRNDHPSLAVQRAPNNAPGRDLEVRLHDGTVIPIEVKDRANLNIHTLAAEVADKQPGSPPIVIWDRKSRKSGNVKRTADGPSITATTSEFFGYLLDIASVVSLESPWLLERIRDKYPALEI